MSKTIDYVPVQPGGALRRLVLLLFVVAGACIVAGYAMDDPIKGSFGGLWIVGGWLLAAAGVFIAAVGWVGRGRL